MGLITNAWSRRLSVGLALLGVAVSAGLATGTASANVQYDLTGVWDAYGTGGGYSGTFTITTMDKATGDFSGTGDGTTFVLKGTEFGTTVQFTQSEGGYVATDSATLDEKNGQLEMVNGVWHDNNGAGGTFTAKKPYSGTISGTVTRGGQPLAGVTLTATDNSGGRAVATTASDGTYTLDLSKLGWWTVTPDGLGIKYKPKDHLVFVTSDSTGVDFNAGGKVSLEMDKHIAIPGGGIDLWYRGKDWDPTGSAVALTFGGTPFGTVQPSAAGTIDGKINIPYWPHRATVGSGGNVPRRACWGDLEGTQGTESAKAEFSAKAVGEVIWTLSPILHDGELFCASETDSALFKGPDTFTWNFGGLLDLYNGGQFIKGISFSNLQNGHHICYSASSQNVHVILTESNGVLHHPTSPGPCPGASGTSGTSGATGST
jgi:hypothetical protein